MPGKKTVVEANLKQYLEQTFGDNLFTTVEQAMEGLTSQFEGLKVSQPTLHQEGLFLFQR